MRIGICFCLRIKPGGGIVKIEGDRFMKKDELNDEKLKTNKVEWALYLVIAIIIIGLSMGTYIFLNRQDNKKIDSDVSKDTKLDDKDNNTKPKEDDLEIKEEKVKTYSKNDYLSDYPYYPIRSLEIKKDTTIKFTEGYEDYDNVDNNGDPQLTEIQYSASIENGKVVIRNITENKSYTIKKISNAKELAIMEFSFYAGYAVLTTDGKVYISEYPYAGVYQNLKDKKDISVEEDYIKLASSKKFDEIGYFSVMDDELYLKSTDNVYYKYKNSIVLNGVLEEFKPIEKNEWLIRYDGTLRCGDVDNVLKTSNGEILYANYLFFYEDQDVLSDELYIIDINRNLYKIDMNKYVANKVSDNPVKKVLENGSEYSVIYENNDKLNLGKYIQVFHR